MGEVREVREAPLLAPPPESKGAYWNMTRSIFKMKNIDACELEHFECLWYPENILILLFTFHDSFCKKCAEIVMDGILYSFRLDLLRWFCENSH